MTRRRSRAEQLEAEAQRFVREREDVLDPPEPAERLAMYRPASADPARAGELGRDPSGLEVLMAREGRWRPLVMPSDAALGVRARQGATRLVDFDEAWRRYEQRRAREREAAATRGPAPPAPWKAPAWWADIGPAREAWLRSSSDPGRSHVAGGDNSQGYGRGSPLGRFRADFEARALELAAQEYNRLNREWLADHQSEIYEAADEGKPWWMTVSPWSVVDQEAVDAFRGVAEWQLAVERRPDDPVGLLLELCLPAARAAARAAGEPTGPAVNAERRRIRALAGLPDPGARVARKGRPKCATPGCHNDAEGNGKGGWRRLCSACRKAKTRTGTDRSARNVKRVNRRKGRTP